MPVIATYFYSIASILITGYVLIISKGLVSPLLAAFLVALALTPLVDKIETKISSRMLSTSLIVFLFIFISLGVIAFFSSQITTLDFELAFWKIKINTVLDKSQMLISHLTGVTFAQQSNLLKDSIGTFIKSSTSIINQTLSFTTHFISSLLLFVISLFSFLYYRHFLVSFLYKVTAHPNHKKLKKILHKIQLVVHHYIIGLSLIVLTIATLNTLGLLALGIENALLFGVLSAVLTIVPYVGIVIGALLPILFAFSTKDSVWYPFGVLMLFMVVQFLEGNFLTPNIVGNKVSVNPLAAILGLLIGGMVLGIMGIIFAIPILAITKVICDEINPLKPIGYLIGNAPSTPFK